MTTRKRLRIAYVDFWPGFDVEDNLFTRSLRSTFDLELADGPDARPDVVFHSGFGWQHEEHDCLRVLLLWENYAWGFHQTDLAITCDERVHPRHYRLPLWAVHYHDMRDRIVPPPADAADRDAFAAVVVSNPGGITRNLIHERLERHRPVLSGGRYRNNVGGPVDDKLAFLGRAKFSITAENSSYPGYCTEKLIDGLLANTVPIYWGDPHVARDLNPRRFVNAHDFDSIDALVGRVVELDTDDEQYLAMLHEPWFADGRPPACADLTRFEQWLVARLDEDRKPVARRSRLVSLAPRAWNDVKMRHRVRTRIH
ncbi:MAG: glycosyltransferase family 10 [Acidimicrobiales bacterium]